MPSISKFLFDNDLGKAKGAPAPKPIRRNFTAAEVEAEKAKAFAEGHAKGVADTAQEAAARAAAAFEAISTQLAKLMAQVDAQRAEMDKAAVAAAVAIARKLLPSLARREAMAEIEALVTECVGRMHDAPKIVVRLNDMHVEQFRERVDAIATATGFSGRLAVVADPAIVPQDARVEWSDGGVERNTAQVWNEIEAAIQRFIASATPQ